MFEAAGCLVLVEEGLMERPLPSAGQIEVRAGFFGGGCFEPGSDSPEASVVEQQNSVWVL